MLVHHWLQHPASDELGRDAARVREAPPDLVQAAAQASSAQGMAPASSPSSGRCGGRRFGAADGGDSGIGSSGSLGQQACFFFFFLGFD